MDQIAEFAAQDDSVYFHFLEVFSELKRSEHKFFLQKIIAKGRADQVQSTIETLMHTENRDNYRSAVHFVFETGNANHLHENVNALLVQDSIAADKAFVLEHLVRSEHQGIATRVVDNIFQLYQYASDLPTRQLAFEVLMKNTDFAGVSMNEVLGRAEIDDVTHLLQLSHALIALHPHKIGNSKIFESQLKQIIDTSEFTTETQQLAMSVLEAAQASL